MKKVLYPIVAAAILASSPAFAQSNFGAIAFSPNTGATGWSYDYNSRGRAESIALSECYKHASDCKVATWFKNACGALYVGNGRGWGASRGRSRAEAERKAFKVCRDYNNRNCKLERWVCTTR